MPAGDLVIDDFQLELDGLLMGRDTSYRLDKSRGGMDGLIDVVVKQVKTEYAHQDGAHIGEAHEASRTAVIWLLIRNTASGAGTDSIALRAAWEPQSTDVPLYWRLPGWGKRYVNGRPGGARFFPALAIHGLIPVMCTFEITDPAIYT
jgi:hypothetical protein